MRYVRPLVTLVAGLGVSGVAFAQAPDERQYPPPTYQQQQQAPPPEQQMGEQPNNEQQQQMAPEQQEPPRCCVEEPAPPVANYQQPPEHRKKRWRGNRVFSPYQISLTLGGGGGAYFNDRMQDALHGGGAWDARLVFGTRSFIAFEAGYIGTANALESSFSNAPVLVGNGLEGNLRINLVPWRVEPYIFGGVGYNHFNLVSRANDPIAASQFRDSDDEVLVPAGAGVSGYIGKHATLDARFTYRAIFNSNILVTANNADIRLDQWTVLGRLGYAF